MWPVTLASSTAAAELEHLLVLLAEEKEAERTLFREEWLALPLSKRRELGISLYPLELEESRLTLGDRWRLSFRLGQASASSELQTGRRFGSGQNVEVLGPDENRSGRSGSRSGEPPQRLAGVVAEAARGRLVVICDESPEWLEKSGLGVDLAFSETTYREMETAVCALLDPGGTAEGRKLIVLRDRLLGAHPDAREQAGAGANRNRIRENGAGPSRLIAHLNGAQAAAVGGGLDLLESEAEFILIHGPPGTGKTTTLVALIEAALVQAEGCTILVTAPTNAAVDLLAEQLLARELKVLRLGHPARVDERLWRCTLEGHSERHDQTPVLAKMRREAEALYREARRYRRHFGAAEAAERRAQLADHRELRRQIRTLEKGVINQILEGARIILTTLVGAAGHYLKGRRFDLCCIDEASQALEAAAWIPILRSDRVVLAGDHHQLPPVVKSGNALGHTLFQKIAERHASTGRIFFLDTQYRMVPEIMAFPNLEFYDGRLLAHTQTIDARADSRVQDVLAFASPLVFVDTAGTEFYETRDPQTQSCRNEGEARMIGTLLARMVPALSDENWSVGVIATYRDQAELLRARFGESDVFADVDLEADTVDSFQGRERDLILISMVRSNEEGDTGFLGETRRMNVALTRAKRLLVVVGDSATLSFHPFYRRFLEHTRESGDYRSAYEFME